MLTDGLKLTEGSTVTNSIISSGPVFPEESIANVGELFYRTDENKLYYRTASGWVEGSESAPVSIDQVLCSMPKTDTSSIGIVRWYPAQPIEILDVFAYCGIAPGMSNVMFKLRKNGVVILDNILINLGDTESEVYAVPGNITFTVDDYLTCDVVQGDLTAKEAFVRIRYTTL